MRYYRPVPFHAIIALGLTACATFALWLWLSRDWSWTIWLALWLLAINLITPLYYGYDKLQAKRQGRRIPEKVLHGLALAGGSLGAFAGMTLFRHKTIKGGFRMYFWTIVALQMGLAVWVVYQHFSA
jgi:uncharacterized membrane protein YsdA (DUF1294 family)